MDVHKQQTDKMKQKESIVRGVMGLPCAEVMLDPFIHRIRDMYVHPPVKNLSLFTMGRRSKGNSNNEFKNKKD